MNVITKRPKDEELAEEHYQIQEGVQDWVDSRRIISEALCEMGFAEGPAQRSAEAILARLAQQDIMTVRLYEVKVKG